MLTKESSAESAGFRLSPQQEQLWRRQPEGPRLAARCVVDVGGSTAGVVRGALERLIARHEILRTTFAPLPGMRVPRQVIHDRLDPMWLEDEDEADCLDAAIGPVVQASFRVQPGRLLLAFGVHAACADARSLVLLARELRAEIAAAEAGAAGEPLQYADYAEWRSEALAAAAVAVESVDGLPASPALPFVGRDLSGDGRAEGVDVPLDESAVARGASACRVPERDFLEACWHACLARVSGEDAIVVAAVLDGRVHDELADAIGPYAQALPLATIVEETTSIAELVDRVRRARARLAERQDGADAGLLADTVRLCRVAFSAIELPSGSGIESLAATPAPFVAELSWIESADGGRAVLNVALPLVESGTAALLSQTLAAIVAAAAADPDAAVLDLPVSAADAEPAVFEGAPSLAGGDTVAQLFERAAAATPTATAVVAADGVLTYAELNERANRLAHRLRTLGVGRDDAVALCMDRTTHSVVALLGAIKAGGAYLPLNYEHPPARLAHQLAESGAAVLLTETGLTGQLPPFEGAILVLDDHTALDGESDCNLDPVNQPDDLVYVMYTSGSTGTPKGAGITHKNLANYVTGVLDRLDLQEVRGATFGAVSALSTDLGNTSVFPALLGGGTLHLVSPADALDGARFAAYTQSHALDVLKLTPSHLRALLDAADDASILPRRWLVLGGEALPWQLVERLRATGSACRIINHYGPTETTIGTCTFEIESTYPQGATVPIGTPLPGMRAYVVDRQLQPLPLGVPGELCIGGAGVARGYVRQPDETAARFLPDPFTETPGALLYRTGDRVRALPNGSIEFLGRVDDQVKIRGYRVEPGEVERVLAAHSSVATCTVIARDDGDGGKELVAYVVGADDATTDQLQGFLRESVPPYMIPARFVRMDALPLTPSGKVDRRALPDPGQLERVAEYVAPRTPVEEELARIWENLLGVERVGVHDDFFALGGHSLLATQAVIRIRDAVADVPLHSLFNAPTVAALAQAIVDAEIAADADAAS